MKASVSYEEVLEGIQIDISRLLKLAEDKRREALEKIGVAVESAITATVPKSDKEFYWYEGSERESVHIADDIEHRIKKARGTKELYVTISGGEKTWQKWLAEMAGSK